jgi:prepilin-type N-terminal cleavage/methylation domain-containing protein
MRTRRGFTLVELLIALVILGLVSASIFSLLNTTQRVTRAQAERTSLQSNVRTGAIVVPAELRELNNVSGGTADKVDILAKTANSIQYRAMRGMGVLCQDGLQNELRIYDQGNLAFSGYRTPAATRDWVYAFAEQNQYKGSDDIWVSGHVTGVQRTSTACPGNVAGYILTISPAVANLALAKSGAPVRTWEDMTLSLYQPAGGTDWYLGAESNSGGGGRQPVLGPLVADSGFTLRYLNASGNETATSSEIRSIQVTFRGLSDQKVVKGAGTHLEDMSDSVQTQVVLRNALR